MHLKTWYLKQHSCGCQNNHATNSRLYNNRPLPFLFSALQLFKLLQGKILARLMEKWFYSLPSCRVWLVDFALLCLYPLKNLNSDGINNSMKHEFKLINLTLWNQIRIQEHIIFKYVTNPKYKLIRSRFPLNVNKANPYEAMIKHESGKVCLT